MKLNFALFIAVLLLLPGVLKAQLEKVIVETYYISDANDATDTTGGYLAPGSKTYRIYIDLSPGWTLKNIYGDMNHTLQFASTAVFFNNIADGQTFAKEFPKNRLLENTVALDTWLTLGQTTRIGAKTNFGVLKANDDDGSFIGGANNDGGSALIASGLLTNNDPLAGVPLTIQDGMDTLFAVPGNWGDYGIIDSISLVDSSIFGSVKQGTLFTSNNAYLSNSGVMGVIPDSNQVLVAQLTTTGDISFLMNIEVDSGSAVIHYVSDDSILDPAKHEVYSRWLKYPYERICGCPDAHYIEYLSDRDCDDESMCQHPVIFGCMDSSACNYNPDANFNLQELCCYPGYCNDRDLDVVCPQNSATRTMNIISVYPNPSSDHINIQTSPADGNVSCTIYNAFGRKVYSADVQDGNSENIRIDITGFENGLYIINLTNGFSISTGTFLKN
jgi:hypothetical protein